MQYCLSNSSYNPDGNEYVFQGVARLAERQLLFCIGLVAAQLPPFLQGSASTLSVHYFAEDDFVGPEGIVTSPSQEGSVSLKGLLAAWAPSSSPLFQDVLAHYYTALHPDPAPKPRIPLISGHRELFVEQLAQALKGKRVLLFTGAGISLAAGLPN